MTYKAIIFDMDGLLVDSEVTWNEAETALFAARGIDYTHEIRAHIIGMRVDEMMVKLKGILDLAETEQQLEDELIARMLELIPTKVVVQPGAHDIVRFVAEQNIPHAIASSSPMSIIDATMDAMGWGEIFTLRCSADDDERGKPAPDVYLRAARLLGFDPVDCLALEDSPTGARAAVAAGMTCYAVPDQSHTKPSAFAEITPYVFSSLHEVLAELQRD